MTKQDSRFEPRWVSPPGDSIQDRLEELGWSQAEFAKRTGYTSKHVNLLINGKAPLTQDTAFRLEKVIGGPVRFWLAREAGYRAGIARKDELSALAGQADWLDELPLSHMVKFGWVEKFKDKAMQVSECLKFFGIASVEAWREHYESTAALAAYKASPIFEKKAAAVAAWLRKGEIEASRLHCEPFDKSNFRAELEGLRTLSNEPDPEVFVPALTNACARAGVAVVFQPAPDGCPVTGATKWLSSGKALLMLSLRYGSNDQLWFAFFHEAAHILLHGKKMLFLEMNGELEGEFEDEADAFARDFLIPPEDAEMLPFLAHRFEDVAGFADKIGIAPGIVVGRMQHDKVLPWNYLNKLKVRYYWNKNGDSS